VMTVMTTMMMMMLLLLMNTMMRVLVLNEVDHPSVAFHNLLPHQQRQVAARAGPLRHAPHSRIPGEAILDRPKRGDAEEKYVFERTHQHVLGLDVVVEAPATVHVGKRFSRLRDPAASVLKPESSVAQVAPVVVAGG
jgi:hypothetical protein